MRVVKQGGRPTLYIHDDTGILLAIVIETAQGHICTYLRKGAQVKWDSIAQT